MADFYNLADQKLFKDYQFLPQEKYRLGLNLPTDATEDEVVTDQGIVNTNAFANTGGGGGDNFSVYNPDPNTIVNQNYDDRPYQTALYNNSFPMMGDPEANIATGALNADGLMSYAGDDDEEPTGLRALISKGANLIPGLGMLRMGAQAIGSLLPTNQRAIFENELGGQGIMVNDIGQIVQGQGDYNTGANIMAGYNANKITDSTVQKRRDTINKSLGKFDKYDPNSVNFDPGKYQEMMDKLDALDEFDKMRQLAFTKTNIVYANENYDPTIETPVGADTTTGPDINEDPNPDGDVPTTEPPGYIGGGGSGVPDQIGPPGYTGYTGGGGSGVPDQIGGGDGPGDRPDNSGGGGHTNPGKGSYGPHFARGGRVKYFYGGKV